MSRLKNRLSKLEFATMPLQLPRVLFTRSKQSGSDGEVIREETDAQVIARHLAGHPNDAGVQFEVVNIVSVSPNDKNNG